MCIVQANIEMENLQYFTKCRILLKWSSCSTVNSAGYFGNGAVALLCIIQDIIDMEQLQYCV